MRQNVFCGVSAVAIVVSAALWSSPVFAADAAAGDAPISTASGGSSVEAEVNRSTVTRTAAAAPSRAAGSSADSTVSEVVVTGSYIAGTPKTTALPVDVINAQDLAKRGSPTMVEIVKSLPAASGSIGETNRLLGASAGIATINLRGFGAARTLVLFNGQRLAPSVAGPAAGGVDVNLIPMAAIGRIEVLKDGAAAIYGSDAVAGVVNFISRTDLDGLEVSGDYSAIKGNSGNYTLSGAWGKKFENGNALITLGYRRIDELRTTDRSWALQPNAVDPFGGWSASSNPGGYTTGAGGGVLPNGSLAQPYANPINFQDDGCVPLGGEIVGGTCRFHYSQFDNLADNETHYQVYGELNYDLTADTRVHFEGMYSKHDVTDERVSPYESTVQFPTPIQASGGSPGGGVSPYPATGLNQQSRFYIPFANPGLTTLFNQHCLAGVASPYSAVQCNDIQTSGVITSQTQWRPGGYGGQPLFSDLADHNKREADEFRLSGVLSGKLGYGNWKYNVALTYMDIHGETGTPDEIVNRLQLGLRGLGGPNCNVAANTPGQNGCFWFNPFANAVAKDAVHGAVNPFFSAAAVPANTNTQALFAWMHQNGTAISESKILVGDAVANGEVPIQLPGGPVAVAVGAQWRYDSFRTNPGDTISDIGATRCVDDVDDHTPTCTNGIGAFILFPSVQTSSASREVTAVFGEAKLPILDNLNADLAVRYEYYGGNIGSTTNPKFDIKWQALPWFALRGSVGTTFRAPPETSISNTFSRSLQQFVDPTNGAALYRAVDTYANPNLQPEKATNYDVGGIFQLGNFRATLDWWKFNFKEELTGETATAIYATMFPSASPSAWQCTNAALASRFTFASGAGTAVNPLTGTNCHPSNFQGVRANLINGPNVNTDGVDIDALYDIENLFGIPGNFTAGVDASYLRKYQRGALKTLDGITIAAGVDRAGKADLLSTFYSDPHWKATFYLNYAVGPHNVRVTFHYVDPLRDINHDTDAATPGVQAATIKAFTPVDLTYRVNLPADTTLTATIQNLFDKDPPFAFSPFNYDFFLASPLGRVFEVAVKKRF
ncbi:TonB-dependent receptor domain-containing protein [Phenylobacterium sp.]|uniref:TonB-dependent receptor domain-containing protein n=1 Tax=Phenylobacterium sp. TaxID=1871053 RepID=UPI0035661AB4